MFAVEGLVQSRQVQHDTHTHETAAVRHSSAADEMDRII